MFEEPAIFDGRSAVKTVAGRINPQQMVTLRRSMSDQAVFESQLNALITSNELFKRDPQTAYALSWGLTFYLAERMSGQYGQYTQRMARLGKLRAYGAADRARDFSRAFEGDISMIATQMQRFYQGL